MTCSRLPAASWRPPTARAGPQHGALRGGGPSRQSRMVRNDCTRGEGAHRPHQVSTVARAHTSTAATSAYAQLAWGSLSCRARVTTRLNHRSALRPCRSTALSCLRAGFSYCTTSVTGECDPCDSASGGAPEDIPCTVRPHLQRSSPSHLSKPAVSCHLIIWPAHHDSCAFDPADRR
jgi:hypothetical protein